MNLSLEHIDFEKKFRHLIGLTLSKVEYIEIDYSPEYPKPWYQTKFKEIDSIDFSIILYFEHQSHAEIYWDGQFFQYGIGLQINKGPIFSGYRKWNVTENEMWKKFIGQSIKETKITWESVTTTEDRTGIQEHIVYPQDLKIEFSNNKDIFISAAAFMDEWDDTAYGFMDNLLVTDNETLAKEVKMIA